MQNQSGSSSSTSPTFAPTQLRLMPLPNMTNFSNLIDPTANINRVRCQLTRNFSLRPLSNHNIHMNHNRIRMGAARKVEFKYKGCFDINRHAPLLNPFSNKDLSFNIPNDIFQCKVVKGHKKWVRQKVRKLINRSIKTSVSKTQAMRKAMLRRRSLKCRRKLILLDLASETNVKMVQKRTKLNVLDIGPANCKNKSNENTASDHSSWWKCYLDLAVPLFWHNNMSKQMQNTYFRVPL